MQNPNVNNDSSITSKSIEKNNKKERPNLIDKKNNFEIKIRKKEDNLVKNNNIKRPKTLIKMNSLIQEKINDLDNRPIEKQNFTWISYFLYLVNLKSNNNKISYYETFRAKLISEENLIQLYLDVYKLHKSYNLLYDNKVED